MEIGRLSVELLLFTILVTIFELHLGVEGSSRPAVVANNRHTAEASHWRIEKDMTSTKISAKLDIVFSDLDGTLIHYPKILDDFLERNMTGDIVLLPSSSTGMVGVISAKSLQLIREIRRSGAIFVLVSGMRSSTLLKRLPYLPKADVYCCEAGGRIFYPAQLQSIDTYRVFPKAFNGAVSDDMEPFSLIEDMEWRKRIEQTSAAGMDGFIGSELNGNSDKEILFNDRKGCLWDFARSLVGRGFTIDAVGYCTCFRVNKSHQKHSSLFDTLLTSSIKVPSELAFSSNLGCVDFYPTISGKKKW